MVVSGARMHPRATRQTATSLAPEAPGVRHRTTGERLTASPWGLALPTPNPHCHPRRRRYLASNDGLTMCDFAIRPMRTYPRASAWSSPGWTRVNVTRRRQGPAQRSRSARNRHTRPAPKLRQVATSLACDFPGGRIQNTAEKKSQLSVAGATLARDGSRAAPQSSVWSTTLLGRTRRPPDPSWSPGPGRARGETSRPDGHRTR